jgi:hypothetical protein
MPKGAPQLVTPLALASLRKLDEDEVDEGLGGLLPVPKLQRHVRLI